jgi:hypothetical protein
MGRAVDELMPFEEAYASTDWSSYEKMPAFLKPTDATPTTPTS